jgi:hypothetical protein
MDLLDCPKDIRDLFYIPNTELEGAISQWKRCDKVCIRCGYCRKLAERVVKVYSAGNTPGKLQPLHKEGNI